MNSTVIERGSELSAPVGAEDAGVPTPTGRLITSAVLNEGLLTSLPHLRAVP